MTKTIHQLDSLTIDKIAAGEVIESPASCIKELVDNALDADAHSIVIEIQLGGRDRILIRDDGKGMSREDLQLSCLRHATSKITSIDDLESLLTLGFRGEALSSIAAISKVSIRSRERGSSKEIVGPGAELTIEGGTSLGISDVTAPIGTQVTITSLFYNVPARRKFLKSPSQNGLEVLKIVKQLAIISPKVAFTLIADGKEVFHVPQADTLSKRIQDVLKEPYYTKSIPVAFEKPGLSIAGLITLPECAKKTRSGQHLFVNGRPVTSTIVSYTVRGAYSSAITSDLHPQFVISLVLDPDRIDVNVHPQKKEIRFADEEWIRGQLYEAVGLALFASPQTSPQVSYFQQKSSIQEPARPSFSFEYEPLKHSSSAMRQPSLWDEEQPIETLRTKETSYIQHCNMGRFSIATLSDRYVLVDLTHALSATLTHHLQKPQSSSLVLTPETIELNSLEMQCVEEKLPWFQSLGFSLSLFGNNTILIEGIPSYLEHKAALNYFKELLDHELAGLDITLNATQTALSSIIIKSFPELQEKVISDMLARRIMTNWIAAGAPPCTITGKKVFVPLETHILTSLFEKE